VRSLRRHHPARHHHARLDFEGLMKKAICGLPFIFAPINKRLSPADDIPEVCEGE
jgi:hypothetical protein